MDRKKRIRIFIRLFACLLFLAASVPVLAACPHKNTETYVTIPPRCTIPGEMVVVCTDCGKNWVKEVPPTGHKPGPYTVSKDAGCTTPGKKWAVCSVCELFIEKTIPAKGHNWGDWTFKETSESGDVLTEQHRCKACRAVETRDFALGMALQLLSAPEEAPAPGEEAELTLLLTNVSELPVSLDETLFLGCGGITGQNLPAPGTVLEPSAGIELHYLISADADFPASGFDGVFVAGAQPVCTDGSLHGQLRSSEDCSIPSGASLLQEPGNGGVRMDLVRVNTPKNGKFFVRGEDVFFKVSATNLSEDSAASVRLSVSAGSPAGDELLTLKPGETVSSTYTVTVTDKQAESGSLGFYARAAGSSSSVSVDSLTVPCGTEEAAATERQVFGSSAQAAPAQSRQETKSGCPVIACIAAAVVLLAAGTAVLMKKRKRKSKA